MGKDTNIEWCDSTINGSSGCDGCELWNDKKHTCYAGILHTTRLALSLPKLYARNFRTVQMIPGRFAQAAAWSDLRGVDRAAKPWLNGLPRCIFVGDMGDFLSSAVTDEFLEREMLGAITSPKGQRHFWMLLTKRPWRLAALSEKWGGLPDNVIAMTTVTSQKTADKRVPHLLNVKAKWRGLSCEPLLSAVDLHSPHIKVETWQVGEFFDGPPPLHGIHWVICGGESGTGAAPMHPDWARSLRDQCNTAGVPYFFKQWGAEMPVVEAHKASFIGSAVHHPWGLCQPAMTRVGKEKAGRSLDGREWNEMPRLSIPNDPSSATRPTEDSK